MKIENLMCIGSCCDGWEENKWFYEILNSCKYDNIKNGES